MKGIDLTDGELLVDCALIEKKLPELRKPVLDLCCTIETILGKSCWNSEIKLVIDMVLEQETIRWRDTEENEQ